MPSIVDMGLAGVLNQPAPFSDPGILLSALALREQKRRAKVDEGMAERTMAENTRRFDQTFGQGVKEFERSAGQADQRIKQNQEELGLRKQAFQVGMEDRTRAMSQEAAASGMFADLGEQMGMFQAPEVRARFEQLAPDDQQRAIGMFQEEQAQQKQQAQFTKLGTLLENAAKNGLMDPAAAQALIGQAESDPANMDAVYATAQKQISDASERNADMQQRQQGVQALGAYLPTSTLNPKRQAAYSSMLLTDPDLTPRDVWKMVLAEEDQLEADRAAGEQLRMQIQQNAKDLMTLNPQANPEQAGAAARLRADKIPVDPDAIGGGSEPRISETDKMALKELEVRIGDAEESKDQKAVAKAKDDYEVEWQRLAKRPFPGRLGSVAKRLFPKVKPEKLTPEQKQKILDEANKGL